MKIMILTASTGGGHTRAANALKEYVERYTPENKAEIIDAIEECSSALNYTIVNGYKALVTHAPGLFGAIYKSSDKKSALSDMVNFIYSQCAKKLYPIIEEHAPDAIISCHPFTGGILGYVKNKFDCDIPLISIVTDFLPHRAYISYGINAYITASEKAKTMLSEVYGVDPGIIYDYGHPVFDRFYEGNGRSRGEVLAELGFDPEKLTVLVMAGSFGVSDVLKYYENLLRIELDYQIIIITGRNRNLYNAFEKLLNNEEIITNDEPELIKSLPEDNIVRILYNSSEQGIDRQSSHYYPTTDRHKPTKLFYYVENVDDYMHASDLIVTKPGGLTTSESIACALPMAIFKAYPGQEEQNAALLAENDIGVILEKPSDAAEKVGALLADSEKLLSMRENCRKYVRKNSSQNIIELAQRLADEKKYKDNKTE